MQSTASLASTRGWKVELKDHIQAQSISRLAYQESAPQAGWTTVLMKESRSIPRTSTSV
jgi:hypothetical protein